MGRSLDGKVAIVTGTSRGIGKAIVELFAERGALVYANARRPGCIDEFCATISKEYSTTVIPVYFDITDSRAISSAFSRIWKEQRHLDVLVNNAGITELELIGMIRQETMERLFQTNVFGPIQMLQYAAKLMKKLGSGSIINMSSIVGVEGSKGELVYSGTKGAIISITKSAAKELAPDHIRVNAIAPGYADTEMFRNAAGSEEMIESHIKQVGFGRLASPLDIAKACAFFASDDAYFVTGQVLGVNGSTII